MTTIYSDSLIQRIVRIEFKYCFMEQYLSFFLNKQHTERSVPLVL